jgi:hypothetical protein
VLAPESETSRVTPDGPQHLTGPHSWTGLLRQKPCLVVSSPLMFLAKNCTWKQVEARTTKVVLVRGAMSSLTLYIDGQTNMDQIRVLNAGDDISVQVVESPNVRADQGVYGTGRKLVREVYLFRGNEKLAGFGGLGQRPNPATERGLETNSGTVVGGPVGGVFPGTVTGGCGHDNCR